MSTRNDGFDAFERSLRDSLEHYEVPYNSSDWTRLERAMNGGQRTWWASGAGIGLLVAGLLVSGGAAWLYFGPEEVASENGRTTIVEGAVSEHATAAATDENGSTTGDGSSVATAGSGVSSSGVKDGVDQVERTIGATSQDVDATRSTSRMARRSGDGPVVSEEMRLTATSKTTEDAKRAGGTGSNESGFTASITEGCPGTSVDFKVSNMPEDGIYLWNFGDGSFSNKANPEHTYTKPGSYQVMLSMSAAGGGSIQNKPSSDVIVIHEAPMAAFNVLKQEYDGHLPSVHFENRSLGGKQFRWDFGDGQTSSIPHPDHIYKKKGVYQVELIVTNEIGCVDRITKDVRIDKDYNLDAPASFSPNGDGFQETFMPEALRNLGVKFMLTVYAPNGTLLYQTNDASKPWTGRPQNRGDFCAPGEYVWVVDVRESLHLAETYTGKVKLER